MLRCTERDKKLIIKCGLCRWLTTTQVGRLYFPGATANAVQKRLRKLVEEGYLRSYREGLLSEALHAPGPKAKAVFEEKSVEYAGASEVPRQVAHTFPPAINVPFTVARSSVDSAIVAERKTGAFVGVGRSSLIA
jgi:hypothetical protein